MPFPVAEWAISLFFLFALILVARFRRQISAVDRDTFKYIFSGLSILGLISIIQVYYRLDVFREIPYVADPTFYKLLSWIGIIAGISLLIFGVSNWLPLARHSREYNQERVRQLEFTRKVGQLVSVERRLDQVLSTTLEYMLDHFSLSRGAVFKYSPGRKLLWLTAHRNLQSRQVSELMRASFDETAWQQFHRGAGSESIVSLSGLSGSSSQPSVVLPITLSDNRPVGFFVVWTAAGETCSREDCLSLKTATDIIARKIQANCSELKGEFFQDRDINRTELLSLIDRSRTLKENLTVLIGSLEDILPFDYFSLTIFPLPGGNLRRFSRGENQSLLEENGIRPIGSGGLAGHVRNLGESRMIADLGTEADWLGNEVMIGLDRRSCLAVPVVIGDQVSAVLTLADRTVGRYRPRHLSHLEYLAEIFGDLIQSEQRQEAAVRIDHRVERLAEFFHRLCYSTSPDQAYRETVAILREELGTCAVRVSEVEDEGAFLKSCALSTQRPIEGLIPADGRMILSLMPNHRLVIDTGRRLLINQDSDVQRMPDSETSQTLSGELKSALLVPVKVDGRVTAMISLVEVRNWDRYRFHRADVVFVEAVARSLGAVLKSLSYLKHDEAGFFSGGRMPSVSLGADTVRTRLKSSLTGIRGSLDLLKSEKPRDEASINRCLSIIDNSARKLEECLGEEVVSV